MTLKSHTSLEDIMAILNALLADFQTADGSGALVTGTVSVDCGHL